MNRILIAVDFSEHSLHALDFALALAQGMDAQLHLVHALHVPPEAGISGWWATLRAQAVRGLDECVERADAAGVKCETHLSNENPVAAILGLIDELDADLLVIGSRGRTGLPHVLLGSVAERAIRLAPCPVITVKADDRHS